MGPQSGSTQVPVPASASSMWHDEDILDCQVSFGLSGLEERDVRSLTKIFRATPLLWTSQQLMAPTPDLHLLDLVTKIADMFRQHLGFEALEEAQPLNTRGASS